MSIERITSGVRATELPLPDHSVQTIVTSPPYWGQRDYGYAEQSGTEGCYLDYLEWWGDVARELLRVTVPSGTMWLVVGDTYNTRTAIRPSAHQGGLGHVSESIGMGWNDHRDRGMVRYSSRQPGMKEKDLMGLPWLMAEVARSAGWWVRCDVIWAKPWGVSENADDRPARSHEYVFLLSAAIRGTKSRRTEFIRENRSVWSIPPSRATGGPASFPARLAEVCIEATSDEGDVVLDPFVGAGTTVRAAESLGRVGIGTDAAPMELLNRWGATTIGPAAESRSS